MDAPAERETGDRAAAAIGAVAGATALAGGVRPLRLGSDDPAVLAVVVLSALVLGTFFGRRWGLVDRRIAPIVAALSAGVVLLVATYGLNQGVTDAFVLPVLGGVPALLVAVVGAGVAVGAATADYFAVSARGIYRRARATALYSGVGVVGWILINVWALVLLLLALPVLTDGGAVEELAATDTVVLSQVATVLGVGTAAVGYLLWTGRDWSFIDLHVPDLRDVAYAVGGFVAILATAFAISLLLEATGTDAAGHSSFERAEGNPEILLVLVPASILVIGPFEELLYRNVIQKSLYGTFSRGGAIVAASVPFALVHFPAYSGGSAGASLVSLGTVLSLSILLGVLYERTDNLVVPALVHGCYNALLYASNYVAMTS